MLCLQAHLAEASAATAQQGGAATAADPPVSAAAQAQEMHPAVKVLHARQQQQQQIAAAAAAAQQQQQQHEQRLGQQQAAGAAQRARMLDPRAGMSLVNVARMAFSENAAECAATEWSGAVVRCPPPAPTEFVNVGNSPRTCVGTCVAVS